MVSLEEAEEEPTLSKENALIFVMGTAITGVEMVEEVLRELPKTNIKMESTKLVSVVRNTS